ncbi:MAG: tetratricopeptide repeat protein [Acidobacteriota bacterium]
MPHPPPSLAMLLLFTFGIAEVPALASSAAKEQQEARGIVVDEVVPGFGGHRMGFQPGDVLLSWRRAAAPPASPRAASGLFDTPWALNEVEQEQAPRGPVTLLGRRAGKPLEVQMPPEPWRLVARFVFSKSELESYRAGQSAIDGGDFVSGFGSWLELAASFARQGDHPRASWLFLHVAHTAARKREWSIVDSALGHAERAALDGNLSQVLPTIQATRGKSLRNRGEPSKAPEAYRAALDLQTKLSPRSLGVARAQLRLGNALLDLSELDSAEEYYRKSLELSEALAPASLPVSWTLFSLANVALERGDLAAAEAYLARALKIDEKLTPQSTNLATTVFSLGLVASARGKLEAAEGFYKRTLAIQETLGPLSPQSASALNGLGVVTRQRGDLVAAENYFRRALELIKNYDPESPNIPQVLLNLGNVASDRGNLASAEAFILRALDWQQRIAEETVHVATLLNNLGGVALRRGDIESAEIYYRRALAISDRIAPGSLKNARDRDNLGLVAYQRGDLATARKRYLEGLEIRRQLAPDSLDVALSLSRLADLASDRGDFIAAERHLEQALAIRKAEAPESIHTARTLQLLGDVARDRGDPRSAERSYQEALRIHRERAPGSTEEATSCHRLAGLHRQSSSEQAIDYYTCAVEAIEKQRHTLGGSDASRAGFRAQYSAVYLEMVDLLVELDRIEESFHMLERYRSRELLGLMAQRDLAFTSDLPADLERRRRLANRSYDRALESLAKLSSEAPTAERQQARDALDGARLEQETIRSEIRRAAPRLAALQEPEPLGLAETRATLEPGTLVLSYAVGEAQSFLFLAGSGVSEPWVARLPVAADDLERDVQRFRSSLARGRLDPRPAKVQWQARQLSRLLLAPAQSQISRAQRLLILPDGPLHSLPFAALSDPSHSDGSRSLIESQPIHVAASATVFALLKATRQELRSQRIVGFGDPLFQSADLQDSASPQMRSATRAGFDFQPLPASRTELEGLRTLFPERAQIFLGAEATEHRAKTIDRATTHLHIATHGLLDDRFPLDSALAFSIPESWREGEENGLLQAWEIFEQIRLDADLVTLSACDTGRGKVLGGEGLMGLTRAFQYAGARSVLASLWSVSDRSTADLMKRFYRYLGEGQSKAEALRNAQLDLLRDAEYSHPFHWAGFQLFGDWR